LRLIKDCTVNIQAGEREYEVAGYELFSGG